MVLAVAVAGGWPALVLAQAAPDAGTPQQPATLDMSYDESKAPPAEGAAKGKEDDRSEGLWKALRPTRVTLAHELSYKMASPRDWVKDRVSARVEYSKHFLDQSFLQFDAKHTQFLGDDHRSGPEGHDTRVSQAYVQSSFNKTSVSLGIQTVAWGESILAPITDEVSPRDNRELFNFNLEELRVGQPMLSVDQYSDWGRFSAFYTPRPKFNKNPLKGSAYYFLPDGVAIERSEEARRVRPEFGLNWRKSFGSADVSLMAARLTDNDFALRADASGRLVEETTRYWLAGTTFSYTVNKFLFKTELGWKSVKAFNDGAMQIVRRREVDSYVGIEYRHSSTLSLSLEGVNQHIGGWDSSIQTPRNRQSILFTLTKLLMNDDLTIQWLQFFNRPDASTLTMLTTTYKWNDNLTLSLNAIVPSTSNPKAGLWNVRDQKQLAFKIQYQF
jgi:hypothetical protein